MPGRWHRDHRRWPAASGGPEAAGPLVFEKLLAVARYQSRPLMVARPAAEAAASSSRGWWIGIEIGEEFFARGVEWQIRGGRGCRRNPGGSETKSGQSRGGGRGIATGDDHFAVALPGTVFELIRAKHQRFSRFWGRCRGRRLRERPALRRPRTSAWCPTICPPGEG